MTCPPDIDTGEILQFSWTKKRDMGRKRFISEQIIINLREAEVLVNQGSTVIEVVRKLGISEQILIRMAGQISL